MALKAFKSLSFRYIINGNAPVAIPVISLRDRPKTLLTCCVPDLKLYMTVINLKRFDLKVYADGTHVVFIEHIIGKSEQKRGLPRSAVSNHDDFVDAINFIRFEFIRIL